MSPGTWCFQKLDKARTRIVPGGLQGKHSPADPSLLAQRDPCRTSDPWTRELMKSVLLVLMLSPQQVT